MLQVRLDFDGGPVRPELLQLPCCEPHRGLGEGAHKPRVPDPRQLRESLGEQVVSRGSRDLPPVPGHGGRHAAPTLGPVHDVVVDQGGRVENLYGGRRPKQVLLPGLPHARAQHQEQRPETFPPDVRASSAGSTRSAGALPATPTSRPSTSSMISKAPSGSAEWSLLACVVWPDPTMERDDAACDALPCNVL